MSMHRMKNIKQFKSSAGLPILVGQDDEGNDYLTFKIAKANDLWFHVNGAPGSHVVLSCAGVAESADKDSIREAAELAAWFSKLRRGGTVSVHYCPVQRVTKPKKAKPGSVNIRRAKNIKVKPALNAGADDAQ